MSSLVLAELREGAAILTLNRPGKLNALNYELLDQLAQNLDRLEDDTSVHVVIITGAGDRAFSAGADIREFVESINDGADAAVKRFAKRGQAVTDVIERIGIRRRLRDHRGVSSCNSQRACLLCQARDKHRHYPGVRRHTAASPAGGAEARYCLTRGVFVIG